MIKYKDLGFRSVEKKDIDLIRYEHNNESVLLMLKDPFIVTETNQEEWFINITKNKHNTVYCIFKDDPDEVIGVWKLQELDVTNRNTEMGMEIFSKYRSKGYSLNCFRMIFKYLFETLNINTIHAKIGEYNDVSLKTAQRAGFRITGKIPEALFRNGKYYDDIVLAITFSDYMENIKPHIS
ncbi:MAG: GNAT family N-acetyltransferase [Ignavibacteria bacterium]|nr:GNAT family N-acetyltransferase [Ignavibacteria bacterium]